MQEQIQGYTLAILDIAKEEKKLKQYNEHAQAVLFAISENPQYLDILKSHSLDSAIKHDMVAKAFKSINVNLLNFIKLLIDKSRTSLLVPVLRKLRSMINEILSIHEGIVYSVEKLTPVEIKKVEATASKKLGYKLTLVNLIDKDLLAGIKVTVGDMVIQNDAADKLSELKTMLLEKEKGSY